MRNRSLVLLAAVSLAMFACSDEDTSAPETQPTEPTAATTTAPPATAAAPSTVAPETTDETTVPSNSDVRPSESEVFSFAEHDLCEWIGAERIADIIAAEYDWEGTAAVFDGADFPPDPGCGWILSGDDEPAATFPHVAVWNGSTVFAASDVALDFEDFEFADAPIGQWVAGHPALDDGVWFAIGGWGTAEYGFPADGRVIALLISVPGESAWQADPLTPTAAVAQQIIDELGWTS